MLEIRLLEARGEAEQDRPRHLWCRLPDRPAAPAGARADRRRRSGPADRRDRPRGRGVRGVPARDPVGLPRRPRDRQRQGRDPAAGDPDLDLVREVHDASSAAPPVRLDLLPGRPRRNTRSSWPRSPRRLSGWPVRSSASSIACATRTYEGAGHRRDARLGGGVQTRARRSVPRELAPEPARRRRCVVLSTQRGHLRGPWRGDAAGPVPKAAAGGPSAAEEEDEREPGGSRRSTTTTPPIGSTTSRSAGSPRSIWRWRTRRGATTSRGRRTSPRSRPARSSPRPRGRPVDGLRRTSSTRDLRRAGRHPPLPRCPSAGRGRRVLAGSELADLWEELGEVEVASSTTTRARRRRFGCWSDRPQATGRRGESPVREQRSSAATEQAAASPWAC